MNILRINIEEITNPVVKDNIRIINKAAKELRIDYFIHVIVLIINLIRPYLHSQNNQKALF